MGGFLLRRGLKTVATLFVVITAVFFLTRITGNPFEREFQDEGLTQEMLHELEEYYGLDKPAWMQYLIYLRELFLRGNAGRSLARGGELVTSMYWRAFKMTGKLVIWCIPLGLVTGIPLGMIGAIKRNTAIGQGAMAVAFIGYAFPNFVIAIGSFLRLPQLRPRTAPAARRPAHGQFGPWSATVQS